MKVLLLVGVAWVVMMSTPVLSQTTPDPNDIEPPPDPEVPEPLPGDEPAANATTSVPGASTLAPGGTGPTTPRGTGPTTARGTGPTTTGGTGPTTARGTGPTTPRGTGPTTTGGTGPTTARGTGPTTTGGTGPTTARGTGPTTARGTGSTTPRGTGPTTTGGTGPTTPRGTGPTTPRGTGPTTPGGTKPTTVKPTGLTPVPEPEPEPEPGMPPGKKPKSSAKLTSGVEPTSTPQKLYCDKTKAINILLNDSKADTETFLRGTQGGNGTKTNMFYATDILMSNLTTLTPVATLLDNHEPTKDSSLYLSFRFTDGDEILRDRVADLVHHAFDAPAPDEGAIGPLKKHVTGVLIDLQGNSSSCPYAANFEEYKKDYPEYYLKWSISLPKYAKKLVHGLLGKPDLPVGVLYNQLGCHKITQQIHDADFLVIKRSFVIGRKFPLTYNRFRAHLEYIADFNSNHLRRLGKTNVTKVIFLLNLMPNNLETNNDFQGMDEDAVQKLLDRSEAAHFPLFKKFAQRWSQTEGRSELIITNNLNVTGLKNNDTFGCGKWHIPFLYVQEVETNPCQLMTMLAESAAKFSNLVVNEYTWRAFARYSKEMTPAKCPKSGNPASAPAPEVTILFSCGIGKMWNGTQGHIAKLLDKHEKVLGWGVKTIVFAAEDVYYSTCTSDSCKWISRNREVHTDRGIPKFAQEMKSKYAIGCLVKMGDKLSGNYRYEGKFDLGRHYLNKSTQIDCKAMWNISSVIVWSFDVPMHKELNEELSFDSGRNQLKRNLLRVLAARERFMAAYPEKEVILQIFVPNANEFIKQTASEPGNVYCMDVVSKQNDLHKGLRTFAALHRVRMIITPSHCLKTPMRGFWIPPGEDGTPSTLDMDADNCQKLARYY